MPFNVERMSGDPSTGQRGEADRWARPKIKLLVVEPGRCILGVDGERRDARYVGSLECAQDCIAQKSATDSLSLKLCVNCEAGQQHDRNGMPCESLLQAIWSVDRLDLCNRQAVAAGDYAVHKTKVGMGSICALVL